VQLQPVRCVFEVERVQESSITCGACSVCCVIGTNAAASGMAEGALHASAVSLVERVLHATSCCFSTATSVISALLIAFDVYCRASCALAGRHQRAAASVSPRVYLPIARVLLLSTPYHFQVFCMSTDECVGRAACACKEIGTRRVQCAACRRQVNLQSRSINYQYNLMQSDKHETHQKFNRRVV
jgi:hypothetical protein